jgi:hypothetical protein
VQASGTGGATPESISISDALDEAQPSADAMATETQPSRSDVFTIFGLKQPSCPR